MKRLKDDRLLRPTEVAELLGLSVQTPATWRVNGRYPVRCTKVGRLIKYVEREVLDFIESRIVSPGQDFSSDPR